MLDVFYFVWLWVWCWYLCTYTYFMHANTTTNWCLSWHMFCCVQVNDSGTMLMYRVVRFGYIYIFAHVMHHIHAIMQPQINIWADICFILCRLMTKKQCVSSNMRFHCEQWRNCRCLLLCMRLGVWGWSYTILIHIHISAHFILTIDVWADMFYRVQVNDSGTTLMCVNV
jgi:hypothetical protein